MDLVIIYPQESGPIAVVRPVLGQGLTVLEIAAKDVPQGVPYLIVPAANLPDYADRANWTADFSNPDGHGANYGAGSDRDVLAYEDGRMILRNRHTGKASRRVIDPNGRDLAQKDRRVRVRAA